MNEMDSPHPKQSDTERSKTSEQQTQGTIVNNLETSQVDHKLNSEVLRFFSKSKIKPEESSDDDWEESEIHNEYIQQGEKELRKIRDPEVRAKIRENPEDYALALARIAAVRCISDDMIKKYPDFSKEAVAYDEASHLYDELMPKVSESDVSKSVLGKSQTAVDIMLHNHDPNEHPSIKGGVPEGFREMGDQDILDELVPNKRGLADAIERRAVEISLMEDTKEIEEARYEVADALLVLSELDAYEKQLRRKIDEGIQVDEARRVIGKAGEKQLGYPDDSEITPSTNEIKKIFTSELNDLLSLADQRAADATYERFRAEDPNTKLRLKDKEKKYDDISIALFELTRLEHLDTIEKGIEQLEEEKMGLSEGGLPTKGLRDKLDVIEATINFLRETKKPSFGESVRIGAKKFNEGIVRQEQITRNKEALAEPRYKEPAEAISAIDEVYRRLGETDESRALETKFSLAVRHLNQLVQEGGSQAIQEKLLPIFQAIRKDRGLPPITIDDLSSVELSIRSDPFIESVTGDPAERPIFEFKDYSQYKKVFEKNTGVASAAFMLGGGMGYLLPENGVDDLPFIVSSGLGSKRADLHEILHTVDVKSRGGARKGSDRILDEAFAYLGEEGPHENGKRVDGLLSGWEGRINGYYLDHTKGREGSKEEYDEKVKRVAETVTRLHAKLGNVRSILRLMAISDSLEEFFKMAEGVLANKK